MNKDIIGYKSVKKTISLRPEQLRFYALATGQTDPIYSDEEAAKAAGHPSIPMAPTFFNCMNALALPKDDYEIINKLDVDISRALHGGERIKFFKQIYAGDEISMQNEVTGISEKKGGALTLITTEMTFTNQDNDVVALKYGTLIIR